MLTVSTKFTLKQAGTLLSMSYHPEAIKLLKLKITPGKNEHQLKKKRLSIDNTKNHFRLHRQQDLLRFEIISTITSAVIYKQRKCHLRLTSSGACLRTSALQRSQGLVN